MTTTPPGDPNASGGYPPPSGPGGYGYGAPQPQSNAPKILGIIGICTCWICGGLPGIVLGIIGMTKANSLGQSKTLPMVALILGVVFAILYAILNFTLRN